MKQPLPKTDVHIDSSIHARLRTLLPLYGEKALIPDEFYLDVPYFEQENPYYSGAACAQMVVEFHGLAAIPQSEIMQKLGVNEPSDIKHETFEVLLSDFFAREYGLLPGHYSPAIHIAPKMGDGITATDFIRGRPQVRAISDHDFYICKRLLVARNAPVIVRIHFTTDLYPMEEEIAKYLDITGHCLVITGYNNDGFVVNDPWAKASLGGQRGGRGIVLSYEELSHVTVMVNCSYEDEETTDVMHCYFEHLNKAVYPDRDIEGRVALYWPGIEGVLADRWIIKGVAAEFRSDSKIRFAEYNIMLPDFKLKPGTINYIPFTINSGGEIGSFQVSVDISANLVSPVFPWVQGHVPVSTVIKAHASYRISVQDLEWFQAYAMSTPLE